MDQILSKLTNLGYEVFGIFIPGVIFGLFLLFWWIGLGSIAPYVTNGFLPEMNLSKAADTIEKFGARSGIGAAALFLISTHFLGHVLQRISRSGKNNEKILRNGFKRTAYCLFNNIPKPEEAFDTKLNGIFEKVKQKLDPEKIGFDWTQFYAVAKNYVARNSSTSLISTYQNKYTLHRSITTAAVVLFWAALISLIGGSAMSCYIPEFSPRWGILSFLIAMSLTVVWASSDSYAYNWMLFGNSVVTESYSILFEPKK
ncbi:hypothetical protein [Hydrogenophaga sp.]|uniref:hypothetical protein n=1 Tax=Hydrogenophaga sp. TaxID=1904254 RepID=UPI003F72D696